MRPLLLGGASVEFINFDKGYKTYGLNGDENNVIRVNLADRNILKRAEETITAFQNYKNEISGDETEEELYDGLEELVRERVDYTFGAGTADAVFGDMSCFAVANDDGECVFETFMNAIMPVIERDIEDAAEKQHKHISDVVDSKKLDGIAERIKGSAP